MNDEITKDALDEIDREIINLLKQNAKSRMQDIGNKVHLTGQTVSNRVNRLEKLGIIKGYSIILDSSYTASRITAYARIFMKTLDHVSFQKWCKGKNEVLEAHRISGDGCYLLKLEAHSQSEIISILDEILVYGNYSLNISIDQIK